MTVATSPGPRPACSRAALYMLDVFVAKQVDDLLALPITRPPATSARSTRFRTRRGSRTASVSAT